MINRNVKTLEEVTDANLRTHYTQNADGSFDLNLADPEGGELRGTNTQLTSQLADANRKLTEATNELAPFRAIGKNATAIQEELTAYATGSGGNAEEAKKRIEAEVDRRLTSMRNELDGKITGLTSANETLTTENSGLKSTVHRATIRDSISSAVSGVALPAQGAMDDIITRAEREWRVSDDGNLVAQDGQGRVRYGKDGKTPLQVVEWVAGLYEKSPFLFQQNSGGGASGSGNTPAPSGKGVIVDKNDPLSLGRHMKAVAAGEANLISK